MRTGTKRLLYFLEGLHNRPAMRELDLRALDETGRQRQGERHPDASTGIGNARSETGPTQIRRRLRAALAIPLFVAAAEILASMAET